MKLYSFFNSSTSYRVRIALALKGLPFDYEGVNIRTLEHRTDDYVAKNPNANVPLLVDEDMNLGQSLAIIDYLDRKHPIPRLIPQDGPNRSRVLELSYQIATDIHPVNNLRILKYLVKELGVSDEQKNAWYAHWVKEGLSATEALLSAHGFGSYCFGDTPSMADCCLVPQVVNAQRMNCDLSAYKNVMRVYEFCQQQDAFQQAAPNRQPDFQA